MAAPEHSLVVRGQPRIARGDRLEVFVDRRAVPHYLLRHTAKVRVVDLAIFRDAQRRKIARRAGDELVAPASAERKLVVDDAAHQRSGRSRWTWSEWRARRAAARAGAPSTPPTAGPLRQHGAMIPSASMSSVTVMKMNTNAARVGRIITGCSGRCPCR